MARMWRTDPGLEAARATPGWGTFMRLCGRQRLFFDVERVVDGYRSEAGTVRPVKNSDCYAHETLAIGMGATPQAAVLDALERSGVAVEGAAGVLFAAPVDEFAGLLGGDEAPVGAADVEDDWEGLLG